MLAPGHRSLDDAAGSHRQAEISSGRWRADQGIIVTVNTAPSSVACRKNAGPGAELGFRLQAVERLECCCGRIAMFTALPRILGAEPISHVDGVAVAVRQIQRSCLSGVHSVRPRSCRRANYIIPDAWKPLRSA